MNRLTEIPLLVGELGRYQHLGQRFRSGGGGLNTTTAVLLGAAVAILLVLAVLISRRIDARQRKGYCSPRALFRELCRAHELDRSGRHLLRRLVRFHQLGVPARIFVEPKLFDPEDVSPALAARRGELESLRDRIFGARLRLKAKKTARSVSR